MASGLRPPPSGAVGLGPAWCWVVPVYKEKFMHAAKPPQLPDPPHPLERVDYLEYHGLVAIQPEVRSSDWYLASQDPFKYYLTRRLGLTSPLSISDALSHGTWFHEAAALDNYTADLQKIVKPYENLIQKRLTELRALGAAGYSASTLNEVIKDEERRAREALAWYVGASSLPFPWQGETYTLRTFLRRLRTKDLGSEITWSTVIGGTRVKGIIDRLILAGNDLYIVDWKTSSDHPGERAAMCPWEFQTQLYLKGLDRCLSDPAFRNAHNIPHSATLAGMYHVIVQKPALKFGQNDRDFTETTKILKSGPNKGQRRTEKTYHGNPKLSNYLDRIREWYANVDPQDPPIDVSLTVHPLPSEVSEQFHHRLDHVRHLATITPDPVRFPSYPKSGTRATALDRFTVVPVEHWPELVQDLKLIVQHRE